MTRRPIRIASPIVAAVVAATILFATYLSTAAPDLTFWDASELITAAHTFGIPHPPGTPLWVLLARVSSMVFREAGPARSVTLLSVIASAAAGGFAALMAARWIGARGAVAAVVSAGTMLSVWNNATETEVYSVSLLLSVLMLYAGERAGRDVLDDREGARWRLLLALLAAFAIPLHLSALVALPAALTLAWRGAIPRARELPWLIVVALIGLSPVFVMLIRAQHHPALNSGNALTISAMIDVLRRTQYDVPGLWPRRAPLWLQIGNIFEWADWQVASGINAAVGPSFARTPFTVLWAVMGVLGLRALWLRDTRVGRALAVLALSGTIGVALWLNLRTGPSYGAGVLPEGAMHEARERDYFFALGFWTWGLLAGIGIANIASTLSKRVPRALTIPILMLAALPMIANHAAADRTREPLATLPRTIARLMLDAVPQGGVLVVAGDNDAFATWYLQDVEGYRTDVQIVTAPLLGAEWYRAEMQRARLLPESMVTKWRGLGETLEAIHRATILQSRALRVSALMDAPQRNKLDPVSGWLLKGLVYAPAPTVAAGTVALDRAALLRSREQIPRSALVEIPESAEGIGQSMQQLLRCTELERVDDSLLVARCGGS